MAESPKRDTAPPTEQRLTVDQLMAMVGQVADARVVLMRGSPSIAQAERNTRQAIDAENALRANLELAVRSGAPRQEPPALPLNLEATLREHRQKQLLWGSSECECGKTFTTPEAYEAHLAGVLRGETT